VGHAALDEWDRTRAQWSDGAKAYRTALGSSDQVCLQQGFGDTWVTSTCLLKFVRPVVDRVERSLGDRDIETRRWWGTGAHDHPAPASFPRTALPTTDALARSTLAVPFSRDISAAEIGQVAEVVLTAANVKTLDD